MLKKKESVKKKKQRKKQDEDVILTGKAKEKEEERLRALEYKFPTRTCKHCLNYPCFTGIENFKSNFAAYGCRDYELNEDSEEVIDYSEKGKNNGRKERIKRV